MSKLLGSLFVKFAATVDDFDKAISQTEKKLRRMGSRMSSIGNQMSIGISLPLIAIGKYALKAGGDFEKSMNKVSALGDITGADLDALKNQALQLGKDTAFSAGEAAEGMGEFAAAGYNATQIAQAMPGALNLAAAAQTGVKDAVEMTVAIMGGFGMAASESGRAADVLAKASAESAVELSDLSYTMKYVAPIAKTAGLQFEEMAAAAAILGNAGIKAETAGTSLRMGIARLIDPPRKAADALSELGINTVTASGKMRPMAAIIGDLKDKGATTADIFRIFGKEAASAFAVLVMKGKPAFVDMTKKMYDGEGAAKKMADTLRQGLNGQIEQTGGSIETAAIAIKAAIDGPVIDALKIIEQLANKVTDAAIAFSAWDPWMKKVALGAVAVAAAAGPILAILGPIATGFSVVTSGLGIFVGALVAIFSPVGAVLIALGALSVLAYEIYDNWDGIAAFFEDTWDKAQLIFEVATGSILTSWNKFWSDFNVGIETIKGYIQGWSDKFVEVEQSIVKSCTDLVTGIRTALVDKLNAITGSVGEAVDKVTGFFKDMYDKVVGHSYVPDMVDGIETESKRLQGPALADPVKDSTQRSKEYFDSLGDKGVKSVQKLSKGAASEGKKIGKVFDSIREKILDLKAEADSSADPLRKQLAGLISAKDFSGIEQIAEGFASSSKQAKIFKETLADAAGDAKEYGSALKSMGTDVANMWSKLDEGVVGFKQTLDPLTQQIFNLISQNNRTGLAELADSFATDADKAEIFSKSMQTAADRVRDIRSAASEAARELSGAFSQVLSGLGLQSGTSNMLGDVLSSLLTGTKAKGAGGQVASFLSDLFGSGSAKSAMKSTGQDIGKTFGLSFGEQTASTANEAIGQNMDGSLMFSGDVSTSITDATSGIAEYGDAIASSADAVMKLGKSTKETVSGLTELGGTAIGAAIGGPVGASIGNMVGSFLGDIVGGLFGDEGPTNAETLAREQVKKFLEDTLKNFQIIGKDGKFQELKDFVLGSSKRFNDPNWGDKFEAMGDQAKQTFLGLGQALTKYLGIEEDVGAQIGMILSENLLGNIDNARLLFQSLGISVQDYEDALVKAGDAGEMTWLEVESALQGIAEAAKPGLVAVGAYNEGLQQVADSAGVGKKAIIGLQNVAVEASEANIKTLSDLKNKMLTDGVFTPDQIEIFFKALEQRGVKTLEQLQKITSREGGGIIADMEAMGFSFSSAAEEVTKVSDAISSMPDNVEKKIHYEFTSSIDENTQKATDNGLFDAAGTSSPKTTGGTTGASSVSARSSSLSNIGKSASSVSLVPTTQVIGRRSAEVSGSNGTGSVQVNIDARHAYPGMESRIMSAISAAKHAAVRDAIGAIVDAKSRGRF